MSRSDKKGTRTVVFSLLYREENADSLRGVRRLSLRCPECGFENPEGRRYCEECGAKLTDLEALKARARRRSQREAAKYRREAERDGLDAEQAERRLRRSRRRTSPWVGLLVIVALIAIIVVIVILATSGGESAPEKAVKDFYASLQQKDFNLFLKLTEPELYKMALQGEYTEEEHSYEYFHYDRYEVEGLQTELVMEQDNLAEVKIVGGTFSGWNDMGDITDSVDFSKQNRTISLVKIEDTWTIMDYNVVNQPTNLPEIIEEGPEFPEVEENVVEPS
jgi:uncharacterized Zn finger protein (UPF0148 family)